MLEFFDMAGGVEGELYGCIPGGSSMPVLNAEECGKANMDYESLMSLGTMLGSGAVMPFNTERDVVQMLATLTRFYAHESCGQCTPCREGTGYADRVMKTVIDGRGHDEDLELMLDLANQFEGTTICPLATADAWPIKNFINKYRNDFDAYIEKNANRSNDRDLATLQPGSFM